MEYNSEDMVVIMAILGVVLTGLLVLIEAVHTTHAPFSLFELRRRQKSGDKGAGDALRREALLAQASTLKAPLSALLLIALLFASIHALGRSGGIGAAMAVGLLYGRIAQTKTIQGMARKFTRRYEARLLSFMEKHESKLRIITGKPVLSEKTMLVGSHEELAHRLEASRSVFSEEDARLAVRALSFKDRLVSEVMTKRSDIIAVKQGELLGPLVLDDLHKTGHEFFPVVHGDIDQVIGILDIRGLLALETKRSITARAAMVPEVVTCGVDQTLSKALALLSSSRQPLLIVTDEAGATVGLLGLSDIIEAMTGYSI